ncbi:MAG TPA: ATP-binding protein [Acidimicrobiales bacterium]|nr:ATP-binding protein [Acidimicrobiales bacterium]
MRRFPPYRPFRGAAPPHFVDRPDYDDLSAAGLLQMALANYLAGPSDPRFHRLVISESHAGKTALLRHVAQGASEDLSWVTAFHGCRPKELVLWRVAGRLLEAVRAKWPGAASTLPAATGADGSWSDLRRLLESLGSFAQSMSRGLLIALDDAHLLSSAEAECVGHLARGLARDRLPVAFLLSGGPRLGAHYARAGYFSGTVWPAQLEGFDDAEAREALVVPAVERGVEFDEEALAIACAEAGGDPLRLQRVGFVSWTAAAAESRITAGDVEAACWSIAQPTAGLAPGA